MQRNVLAIHVLDTYGLEGLSVVQRVIHNYRDYPLTIASAILAQNNRMPQGLYRIPIEHFGAQLEAVTDELEIHAAHIGILPDLETARLLHGVLSERHIPTLTLDPIMHTSHGLAIHTPEQLREIVRLFTEQLTVLAPNIMELAALADVDELQNLNDVKQTIPQVYETYKPRYLVVKGGRLKDTPRVFDIVYDGLRTYVLDHGWQRQRTIYGKGDAYAAVLNLLLARNIPIQQAADRASKFVTRAMSHAFILGDESLPQPLNLNIPTV